MNMRDAPEPEVAPDEICVQVSYAGICGSELGGYLGHNALRVPPLIMGHEFAGEVVAVGTNLQQPELAVGKLVTVNPLIYCGTCPYCQRGLNQLCVNRRLIGGAPARRIRPIRHGSGAAGDPAARGHDSPHRRVDRAGGLWCAHRPTGG